ncbi:M23 family peptidase [Pseudoflavonifractor sp. 60]|uniref:M23 family metallopeptidase n=1 Tax=Pseudoflavonifractor sp. 60 TaxID=2304576 RepID=UPI00137201A9|nr:M23 family metallopeptidase [Pseudoflavonifractor sp. 60]NBI65986.1 M23 family peptidase [Pseudoflavonifractor sp. 60]
MADPILLAKAAAVLTTSESARKTVGWIIVAVLSPLIVVLAFLISYGAGSASSNISTVELCFYGGPIPDNLPEEYRARLEQTQNSLSELDNIVAEINAQTENSESLDAIRVKALFYALYFGAGSQPDPRQFADCFVTYEERTGTEEDEDYTVAVPIENMEQVYQNIRSVLGVEPAAEQMENADSIYDLIRYGYTGGSTDFTGAAAPFIGADGFCSPIGANWRNVVTSEFGNRRDPITGERRGHNGMDLAVPTGTPVRAALAGKVTAAKYDSSYGSYVMIDHGNGLATLYAHNSKLVVKVGQTVQAGDVVSLSGSTGRSTGPHLHFEVRINGERTNPRSYLP